VGEDARRVLAAVAVDGQRPHQRERVEVDALGLEAGRLHGLQQRLDHLAAGGHQHDLHARGAVGRLGVAGDLVVEHGLVQRHRDRLGGLEADRGVALLLVLDARQLDDADHYLLVGHAEAHVPRQAGVAGEALEVTGELQGVRDLAVADESFGKVQAGDAHDAPVVDLRGGQVAAVDVEPDRAAL
jgi:hypothetical protein